MNFKEAIDHLNNSKCLYRRAWKGDCGNFICKQVVANIYRNAIRSMQSLPNSAKELIMDFHIDSIKYRNQLIMVTPTGEISSWTPSNNDIFADDWEVIITNQDIRKLDKSHDLYTFDEWKENVLSGGFIDYDGFGYWSDGINYFTHKTLHPSKIEDLDVEDDSHPHFSHVVWFNR